MSPEDTDELAEALTHLRENYFKKALGMTIMVWQDGRVIHVSNMDRNSLKEAFRQFVKAWDDQDARALFAPGSFSEKVTSDEKAKPN